MCSFHWDSSKTAFLRISVQSAPSFDRDKRRDWKCSKPTESGQYFIQANALWWSWWVLWIWQISDGQNYWKKRCKFTYFFTKKIRIFLSGYSSPEDSPTVIVFHQILEKRRLGIIHLCWIGLCILSPPLAPPLLFFEILGKALTRWKSVPETDSWLLPI